MVLPVHTLLHVKVRGVNAGPDQNEGAAEHRCESGQHFGADMNGESNGS
jgi:hypothetical protein